MHGDVKLERVLFDDYRYYRNYTTYMRKQKSERPYLRDLKVSAMRLKLFAEMIVWCRTNSVEPRQWLYSLFDSRKWVYPPRLESTHLCSKKHLIKFPEVSNYTLFKQRQINQQNLDALSVQAFDPNRDIGLAIENVKRSYLFRNDFQVCMLRIAEETYGYHPRSTVCARCPVTAECETRLGQLVDFDIQALRRGEITSEMARSKVLAGAQRYGAC